MTSGNVFSNLLPTKQGRSFYEELRGGDDHLDVEGRAGLLDEENLNQQFHDYDLEHAEGLGVDDSRASIAGLARNARGRNLGKDNNTRWFTHDDDIDNDVPASLLVEPHEVEAAEGAGLAKKGPSSGRQAAIPGSSSRKARALWETTQTQQRLHQDDGMAQLRNNPGGRNGFITTVVSGNAKKRAEWRWANVSNLDNFIKDVYDYYHGYGIWCILLERFLHLVNVAFVAVFLTFLSQCVNYSRVRDSKKMSDILVPQCTKNMSSLWNLGLWIFAFYFIWKAIQYLLDLRRLFNVRDFYIHLLSIPDEDMQTVTWQEVVARVMALRDQNPKTATHLTPAQRRWIGSQSKERLDASDIANRLMRRENYLIALFNKDILDLRLPIPFMRSRELFSRTLEWTLMFSILDFVFDEKGQVNQEFLKSDRRGELSMKLRGRFFFAGLMNLALAPFLTGYLLIVYFLTYYQEYQRNPSAISARTYTPLAEWKFREFNELPHLFRKRLDMSHAFASHYIDQFPKVKLEMVYRTVAFMAGAVVTVLAITTLVDPELFLNFEVTPDRTVLFYVGVLTAVWVFAHGSVSAENNVFDPEFALRNVIEYTHYEPDHWNERLNSYDVKKEFSELYKMKIVIFFEEVLSILVTPLMLFISLPKSSDQIIDFFREFTIHVDGLGYVCSFAEFDFKKGIGNSKKPSADGGDVRDDYYSTKHGKMEASYYGFMGNYGNYMLSQKPSIPNQLPPSVRHQFHPPPAWPTMSSPTLAADLHASRTGRSERPRSRAPARTPRFGPAMPTPSPMASILLDPHHQPPSGGNFGSRSTHRPRQGRERGGGYTADTGIIEESLEDGLADEAAKAAEEEDAYESGGALDESTWQTSPTKTLSRETSGLNAEEPVAGVVGMIYQFNQAQLNRRPGGAR